MGALWEKETREVSGHTYWLAARYLFRSTN